MDRDRLRHWQPREWFEDRNSKDYPKQSTGNDSTRERLP